MQIVKTTHKTWFSIQPFRSQPFPRRSKRNSPLYGTGTRAENRIYMTGKGRPLRSWGGRTSGDKKQAQRKKFIHGSRTVPISPTSDNPYRSYTAIDLILWKENRGEKPEWSREDGISDSLETEVENGPPFEKGGLLIFGRGRFVL